MGESKVKSLQFRKLPKTCVYCAERSGTTADHVPPKGIFTKPRPQLITVPACPACNCGASTEDQEFKSFLSIKVAYGSDSGNRFWINEGIRSIKANNKLRNRIVSAEKMDLFVDGRVQKLRQINWPSSSHDGVIKRISRGLYWYHFKEILSVDAAIDTFYLNSIDDDMLEIINGMNRMSLGGDDCFVYAYGRHEVAKQFSLWFFQFYQAHWAAAVTYPSGFASYDAAVSAAIESTGCE